MKETVGKKIWDNRKQILEGIKNRVFQSEPIEKISAIRMEICNKCDEFDPEGVSCSVPGTAPCCGNCGCSLAFKTRSLSSHCPMSLWDKVLTEEEDVEHEILNPNPDA